MKDLLDREIKLDDLVAFNTPNFKELTLGKVIGFTSKQVRIAYCSTWNKRKEILTICRMPGNVAILDGQQATMYVLKNF